MELIDFCIRIGRVYESEYHHNAVFVGMDQAGEPKYAAFRGISTDFIGEASIWIVTGRRGLRHRQSGQC